MAVWDDAFLLLSNSPMSGGFLVLAGFLICHLIHAIRYAFIGYSPGGPFERIKKFFKLLLFLGSFS